MNSFLPVAYLRHYGHCGYVWQGRLKAFPIQEDEHLLTVVRYVERNPLRAGLPTRAEGGRWSSLRPGTLAPGFQPACGELARHLVSGSGAARNNRWRSRSNSSGDRTLSVGGAARSGEDANLRMPVASGPKGIRAREGSGIVEGENEANRKQRLTP